MEKKEREELIERLDIMDGFPEWKVPCHSCQKGGMIEDMNGNVYTCGECGGSEWIVNPELVKVFEQELDKAREEGRREGIEHTVRLFKDKQQLKEWLEKNDIEGVVKNGDVVEAGKKYATTINLN